MRSEVGLVEQFQEDGTTLDDLEFERWQLPVLDAQSADYSGTGKKSIFV
jgi:hypothetical protein